MEDTETRQIGELLLTEACFIDISRTDNRMSFYDKGKLVLSIGPAPEYEIWRRPSHRCPASTSTPERLTYERVAQIIELMPLYARKDRAGRHVDLYERTALESALTEALGNPPQDGDCQRCDGKGCAACDVRAQPPAPPQEEARDAARYRWLRDKSDRTKPGSNRWTKFRKGAICVLQQCDRDESDILRGEELDAAIDAARAAMKGETP